jgi:hypothetical protein
VIDALRLTCWVAILAAVIFPAIAYAGDEDSRPAYMIYIDPETGKYTTDDPDVVNTNAPVVPVSPASEDNFPSTTLYVLIGGALAMLLAGAMLKHQRRQHSGKK